MPATFCFSIGYFVHYQLTGNGASVQATYEEDMRQQRELVAAQSLGQEMTEDGLAQLMKDPALMKDGRTALVLVHGRSQQGKDSVALKAEWIDTLVIVVGGSLAAADAKGRDTRLLQCKHGLARQAIDHCLLKTGRHGRVGPR